MARGYSPRAAVKEDWQPDSKGVEFAVSLGVDVEAQVELFRDYHLSVGNKFASWSAAWRTWCRNCVRHGDAPGRVPDLIDLVDPFGANAWAAKLPGTTPGTMVLHGEKLPTVEGWDVAGVARDVCEALRLEPSWRGDLGLVAEWLRLGVDPDLMTKEARRQSYRRATMLRQLDRAMRKLAGESHE